MIRGKENDMHGVVFDGECFKGGYTWVILTPTATKPGGMRHMHHMDTLSAEDRARLDPDSERDVKKWLAEGAVHEIKAPKGAKE